MHKPPKVGVEHVVKAFEHVATTTIGAGFSRASRTSLHAD